ncbi:hypothetical protein SPI_07215 [Niveomyces insectorum RCEF 264]|uniref:Uncharacterized protein n=1 Tax=Niveomyces insectorum RCEF 264 TaxID=1081102 RepID=A0A167QE30_9HYPO|nr:hypothetical protein SPI_07215 [Niveomyces insectorum RCEF 264]
MTTIATDAVAVPDDPEQPATPTEWAPDPDALFSATAAFDEEDDVADTQLGPKKTRSENKTPQSQYSPRDVATVGESPRGHFAFNIQCDQPVFGTARRPDTREDVPACRVVFTAAFQRFLTKRRYRMAKITVTFEDGAVADRDPDDDADEAAIEAALPFQPRVLAYEPKQWWGREETGRDEIRRGGTAGLSSPGLPVTPSASVDYRRKTTLPLTDHAEIEGNTWGPSRSAVRWSLTQNEVSNHGIINRLALPIVVQYTPGRPFVARIRVVATVDWGLATRTMRAGKLDDPIRFDPDKLGANNAHEDLNDDLKPLCGLDGYRGRFRLK